MTEELKFDIIPQKVQQALPIAASLIPEVLSKSLHSPSKKKSETPKVLPKVKSAQSTKSKSPKGNVKVNPEDYVQED